MKEQLFSQCCSRVTFSLTDRLAKMLQKLSFQLGASSLTGVTLQFVHHQVRSSGAGEEQHTELYCHLEHSVALFGIQNLAARLLPQ